MTPNAPVEDLFALYESQYVTDLDGRLIRFDAATQDDLKRLLIVTIDGQDVKDIPLAVPKTDDQGNIVRDEDGHIVPRRTTVYDAVTWRYRNDEQANFPGPDPKNPVPVLCHVNHQQPLGVCRVCSVLTLKNGRVGEKLIPACQHPLVPGRKASESCMEIHTVASTVPIKAPGEPGPIEAGAYLQRTVKVLLQLLAVNHLHQDQPPDHRLYRNELLDLCRRFEIPVTTQPSDTNRRFEIGTAYHRKPQATRRIDNSSPVIQVDHDNCVLCDRCVRGCSEVKPFKIIGHTGFGNKTRISFDLGRAMGDSECVSCGECAVSCPTGALTFKGTIYQDRDPWANETVQPETIPAETLADDDLFKGVPYAFLKWNQGAVGRLATEPGTILCQQGEFGSTAFLLKDGNIDIVVKGNKVAQSGPKDVIVGELACLSHLPRGATLRAADAGEVWVVKRNMLHMLQRNRAARALLGPIYRERALATSLRQGQLFQDLSPEQAKVCIDFLKEREEIDFVLVDPGQAVFLQGQEADDFYIIYRGHVRISMTNASGQTTVGNYLGPGRQFGEIGLLSTFSERVGAAVGEAMRGKRTTTCTALDHVELVAIPQKAFRALLDKHPAIRKQLEDRAVALLDRDKTVKREVNPLMAQHTGEGLYQGRNLLVLDLNNCTRCQECVKACAESHQGVTRLILEGNRFEQFLVPSACRSCHDPGCLTGCPVDAIHRKPAQPGRQSLAIFIDDHCIGCGLCSHNCPYGSIHMIHLPDGKRRADGPVRMATNCDLCESLDGVPRCVHRCPHDAAIRITGKELAERVGLRPLGGV